MLTPKNLAALHARAFAGQSRGWSAEEFAALLETPLCFVVGDKRAFALGRAIADEVELLTIATAPEWRRQGLGRQVLLTFHAAARNRGANTSFLEVDAENKAAVALYLDMGYVQTAVRTGYYRHLDGTKSDALMLSASLT